MWAIDKLNARLDLKKKKTFYCVNLADLYQYEYEYQFMQTNNASIDVDWKNCLKFKRQYPTNKSKINNSNNHYFMMISTSLWCDHLLLKSIDDLTVIIATPGYNYFRRLLI